MSRLDESAVPYDCIADTPWGPLAARFSDIGLMKAWFPDRERAASSTPAEVDDPNDATRATHTNHKNRQDVPSGPDGLHSSAWPERLSEAVNRFLADGAVTIPLDLTPFRPWTRAVYTTVLGIPPGRTTTYGALAASTGRPGAARAVGAALSRQPFAFFLPTHRVLPARGGLGRCTSGAGHLRLELLRREGIV